MAHVRFKQDWSNSGYGGADTLAEGKTTYFYGLGLLAHASENFTIGFEYNTQTFKASTFGHKTNLYPGQRIKTTLDVYKLKLAYNF